MTESYASHKGRLFGEKLADLATHDGDWGLCLMATNTIFLWVDSEHVDVEESKAAIQALARVSRRHPDETIQISAANQLLSLGYGTLSRSSSDQRNE